MFSRVRQKKLAICLALAGAVSFWLPDVVIQTATRRTFDALQIRTQVRIITFLLPATFLCAYVVARMCAAKRNFKWVGAVMLLGIWLAGGLFMMVAATAAGGGFAGPDGIKGGFLLAILGVFPPVALMMSTYDGSLGALLIVNLGSLLFWGIRSSGMPLPFRRSPR